MKQRTEELRRLIRSNPVPAEAAVNAIGVPLEVPYMFCSDDHAGYIQDRWTPTRKLTPRLSTSGARPPMRPASSGRMISSASHSMSCRTLAGGHEPTTCSLRRSPEPKTHG